VTNRHRAVVYGYNVEMRLLLLRIGDRVLAVYGGFCAVVGKIQCFGQTYKRRGRCEDISLVGLFWTCVIGWLFRDIEIEMGQNTRRA
jgi:hypothetical protein